MGERNESPGSPGDRANGWKLGLRLGIFRRPTQTSRAAVDLVGGGSGGRWYGGWAWLLGLLLLGTGGCGRAFYRRQADQEVHALVDCASDDPRWPLEGFTIQPDPQSRMFDPFSPDYPPMPPDDPTSHRLMHCVDCKRGWPCWHCSGDTPYVENPDWESYLPFNEKGQVVLDREGAMEMALVHSREYQQELELLYLSALDVTFERFQFDTQFFGGNATFFTVDGPLSGSASSSSTLSTGTTPRVQRLFATGGQLVVDVANSVVWQFAGPDRYSVTTPLNFSLIQPLLRAGGRAVVLELLTTSERVFLADIRSMERFRREFYTRIVASGLGGAPGFLDLLEDQVRIRNQEGNVARLRLSLNRLEAGQEFFSRGAVDRARQNLYNAQSTLLESNAAYEDRLDGYKIALGLPPELDVRIEDPLLARFDLIEPELTLAQRAAAELVGPLNALAEKGQLDPKQYAEELTSIQQRAEAQLGIVAKDIEALQRALPERRRSLRRLATREEFRRKEIDPSIGDVGTLESRVATVQREFASITGRLKSILQGLQSFLAEDSPDAAEPGAGIESAGDRFAVLVDELSNGLLELSLIQAQARLDAITLVPIDMTPEKALDTARRCRRDWMNERATLVDVWRQIEVGANDLQSELDVTFSGNLTPTSNSQTSIHNTTGQLRLGLEFDAPLTRLAERNAYRLALINYQQARRVYYAFEDGISRSLRSRLRTIRVNQLDFEVQRAAVLVAIARVEESYFSLRRPPKKVGGGVEASGSLVETLLDAHSSLLNAQNSFLNVWVQQEVQRMNLDLDLGTMQLDARGLWIDPGPVEGAGEDQGDRAGEAPFPPGDAEQIQAPAGEPVQADST